MAKRISVINFKGGVGKTTFAFNFAAGLALHHRKRVLLVDMDHQSSLSIVCLTGAEWQKSVQADRIVDAIFRPFISGGGSLPGNELIHKAAIKRTYDAERYQTLDLVPASLNLDDIEIDLTASHRGGSVCLNSLRGFAKWIVRRFMPLPGLASAL